MRAVHAADKILNRTLQTKCRLIPSFGMAHPRDIFAFGRVQFTHLPGIFIANAHRLAFVLSRSGRQGDWRIGNDLLAKRFGEVFHNGFAAIGADHTIDDFNSHRTL